MRMSCGKFSRSASSILIVGASPHTKSRRTKRYRPPATQLTPGRRVVTQQIRQVVGGLLQRVLNQMTRAIPFAGGDAAHDADARRQTNRQDPRTRRESLRARRLPATARRRGARAGFAIKPTSARAAVANSLSSPAGVRGASHAKRAPRRNATSPSVPRSCSSTRAACGLPTLAASWSKPCKRKRDHRHVTHLTTRATARRRGRAPCSRRCSRRSRCRARAPRTIDRPALR